MANHGLSGRPEREHVPDWLLGGTGRHRMLRCLAEPGEGWTGKALEKELDLGHAWVFEFLRALRATAVIERVAGSRGSYRLSETNALAHALRALLIALEPYEGTSVDRPPSRRG